MKERVGDEKLIIISVAVSRHTRAVNSCEQSSENVC